jgi:hypothetical protein
MSGAAANATITTNGDVHFFSASTADNASIIVKAGGEVFFEQQSSGGTASITLAAGSFLDITKLATTTCAVFRTTLGSLDGDGTVFLGNTTLGLAATIGRPLLAAIYRIAVRWLRKATARSP